MGRTHRELPHLRGAAKEMADAAMGGLDAGRWMSVKSIHPLVKLRGREQMTASPSADADLYWRNKWTDQLLVGTDTKDY